MILKMQNGSPFKAVTFQDFSTPAKSGSSSPKKTTTEEKDEADVIELLQSFQKDLIDKNEHTQLLKEVKSTSL